MKIINFKTLFIVALSTTTFFACNNKKKTQETEKSEIIDNHTAQNALDWHGTYSGNLPCADCDRIETELTLNNDQTYRLISQNIGKRTSKTDSLQGKFSWKGNNVNLEGIPKDERPYIYKVEENQVRQLDMEGKEITGDLAQAYVMKKNGNMNVEDKKWQLVELNGKKVEGSAETHYLIFHSKDGRVEAKANCNILSSEYKIKNKLQLKIEVGISTLMACPNNIEDEFKKVLYTTNNLSTDGQTLSLNKARMAPLARFVLVK